MKTKVLYRVENQNPDRREEVGRWFTDNFSELRWYFEHKYPLGRIMYLELPVDIAEYYRVSNFKKNGSYKIHKNPAAYSCHPKKEYFLPKKIATKAEVYISEGGIAEELLSFGADGFLFL
ncbi:MAG: hypothetical protein KKC19_03740 [Nanoarchaeota archaeon]|nr:hypothetical protein [Nanoarchaeota archaeon]